MAQAAPNAQSKQAETETAKNAHAQASSCLAATLLTSRVPSPSSPKHPEDWSLQSLECPECPAAPFLWAALECSSALSPLLSALR